MSKFMLPGISTPISITLSDHLTPEEREQVLQTIEMFETIVQATPDDHATLEILKEAYWKIGRLPDARSTSRRLADLYMELEQPSAALTEYLSLLEQDPTGDDISTNGVAEIVAELEQTLRGKTVSHPAASISLDFGSVDDLSDDPTDPAAPADPADSAESEPEQGMRIEMRLDDLALTESPPEPNRSEKAAKAAKERQGGAGLSELGLVLKLADQPGAVATPSDLPLGFFDVNEEEDQHTLIATPATLMPAEIPGRAAPKLPLSDGLEPLAKFLIQHRLVPQELVDAAVNEVRLLAATANVRQGTVPSPSLLNEICKAGYDMEVLLAGIIDRTKFAYVPLEFYDIDRQIVKMLPENLTLGRLVVPFDMVSRTLMVAIDNPFDAAAKNAVQQSLDYHIQWHLALPHVIQRVLREVYRLLPE